MCVFDFRPPEFPSKRNTCRPGIGRIRIHQAAARLSLGLVAIEQLAGAGALDLTE
jgi:hypothetical protein